MLDTAAATSPSATAAAGPNAAADTSGGPLRHRPEIDGLRAFAILPILLLHCGVYTLRGGYVGVDIFFVISGYLITAIIEREIASGTFSLLGFYRRRIVRLLPALLVMLAAVLAIGCVLLFPVPLQDLARSVAATAAFGSNIYFYATSDYFALASDVKPLVHTWSLAVEEQFYVLYPLLLLGLRHLRRPAVIAVLIAIGMASLIAGGFQAAYDPTGGFYLLPSRAWELVLGALVALGFYPRFASAWLRELACWLALVAILASIATIKSTWPFPVPFALPPAGAAALLLAYAPQTRAARLLSWAPLRWIGRISYSLYLWHRPIIAYYLIGRSWVLTPLDTAILLVATFTAATASYLLVERPAMRRWRKPAGAGTSLIPHAVAAATLVLMAAAGLAIAAHADQVRKLPPDVARVVGFLGFDRTPAGKAQYGTDTCFMMPFGRPYDPACRTPVPGGDNVLLVGDSHAAQLSQALRAAIAPTHLLQVTAAGCRPVLVTKGLATCRELSRAAITQADPRQVRAVVLAGRWFDIDLGSLADTIRLLRAHGIRHVVVMGPMVEYEAQYPELLGRAMLAHDLQRMAALRMPDRAPLDRTMRSVVTEAGGDYVSHFDIECPNGDCRLFTPGGAPLHIDQSHLTPEAAEPVARRIAQAIEAR